MSTQSDKVTEPQRPLDGVRVVDLSRILSGPLCGMLLGDMGADVVKVERPGGEDTRRVAPFFRDESIHTMTYNRNKRGMTLDTRAPQADKILERLVIWGRCSHRELPPGDAGEYGVSDRAPLAAEPQLGADVPVGIRPDWTAQGESRIRLYRAGRVRTDVAQRGAR